MWVKGCCDFDYVYFVEKDFLDMMKFVNIYWIIGVFEGFGWVLVDKFVVEGCGFVFFV